MNKLRQDFRIGLHQLAAFIYQSLFQLYNYHATILARTRTDPAAAIASIRRVVQTLNAPLPIYDVKTLTEHMRLSLLPARDEN
jgi:hypothetical protein